MLSHLSPIKRLLRWLRGNKNQNWLNWQRRLKTQKKKNSTKKNRCSNLSLYNQNLTIFDQKSRFLNVNWPFFDQNLMFLIKKRQFLIKKRPIYLQKWSNFNPKSSNFDQKLRMKGPPSQRRSSTTPARHSTRWICVMPTPGWRSHCGNHLIKI